MQKYIVYAQENGQVALFVPSGEVPIEECLVRHCPVGAKIVTADELPQVDDSFFDAWVLVNGSVQVSFPKAQEITRQRLRYEREPLLQEQDVAFQRALETGADTAAIVAEKQRLRDVTKKVDTCTTLDQLRALSVAK